MTPKQLGCFIILFTLFVFAVHGFSQEDMRFVDNSQFSNPARPAAVFNHDEHNETHEITDCTVCHHVYKDGKLVEGESSEDQRCLDCHGGKDSGNTVSLRNAFHRNCKGCHLENNAGPIMCGQCHQLKPETDA